MSLSSGDELPVTPLSPFLAKNSKFKCSLYLHFSIFGSSFLLHSWWCSLQFLFALFHFEGFPKGKLASWNEDDESVCGDCWVGVRCNPRKWGCHWRREGSLGLRFSVSDVAMMVMVLRWQDSGNQGELEVMRLRWRRGAQWGQGREEG